MIIPKPMVGWLLAILLVLAGVMALVTGVSEAASTRASTPRLLIGTVQLDRHREVNKQKRLHPGAEYTLGHCKRASRSQVSCQFFELRTREGVREKVTHTISERVAYTKTGRIRYTSFRSSDPVEA